MAAALRRGCDAAFLSEISKSHFHPVFIVWIDWPSDPLFAHSGVGEMSWDGQIWTGLAPVGSVSMPVEGGGIAKRETTFSLVLEEAEIADRIAETFDSSVACKVWFGAVTKRSGNTLIGQPILAWSGYSSGMKESVSGGDGWQEYTLTITTTSGPSQRTIGSDRITYEVHKRDYPDDTLLRHIEGATNLYNSRSLAVTRDADA
jgi:hypothetical protein